MLLRCRPDDRFLPSQRYLTRISMQYTRLPLQKPGRAALVNLFAPCEILHAMDIYPQCAEGFSSYLTGGKSETGFLEYAAQKGVPDTFCSYHRALIGAAESGMLQKPRFLATTSIACDANTSTFRRISDHTGAECFYIDVPFSRDADAVQYVAAQIRRMAEFVQDAMHQKLEENRFLQAIRNTNESMKYHRLYLGRLEEKYFPSSPTLEMFRVFASHILLGSAEAATFYKMQYEDILSCGRSDGKRVMWSHVLPYYSQPLQELFAFNPQMQLLVSDMNFDALMELNEKKPYESMAKRLIENHFNGCFTRKQESFLRMAEMLRADGAVLFCHWGCKQSNGGVYLLKDALKERGIPALVLDGDACDRRNTNEGQVATRLQAFQEMLG